MSAVDTPQHLTASEFEVLVGEHQVGLRAFVRALGVEEGWVDDVAQEVFVVAYRRLADFEKGTDFGKWLRGIGRHLVANERRKEARRSRLLPQAVADILFARGQSGEELAVHLGGWLSAMQECVAQLPPRSQELLRRRYAAGENASSLARELGLRADALRQTLLRMRLAVKECIEKKTGGEWR